MYFWHSCQLMCQVLRRDKSFLQNKKVIQTKTLFGNCELEPEKNGRLSIIPNSVKIMIVCYKQLGHMRKKKKSRESIVEKKLHSEKMTIWYAEMKIQTVKVIYELLYKILTINIDR